MFGLVRERVQCGSLFFLSENTPYKNMNSNKKSLKALYTLSKEANVGTQVNCPSCGVAFEKTNHQQAFCKSKGGTICKDNYWNNVTPSKRNNTTRISPANASYYETHIKPLRERNDWPEGWDEHKDS